MAYDPTDHSLVLFGGTNQGQPLQDTWRWDGTTWSAVATSAAPPPRTFSSLGYDAGAGSVVLFGGQGNGGPLGDTWLWRGGRWAPFGAR